MELSFVQPEDVMAVVEGMIALLFKELKGIELKRPFAALTYEEAMNRFGSDKPDMRFGLELCDFTDALRNCQAKVFTAAIQEGRRRSKAFVIPNGGEMSRKDLDDMTPFVATFGGQGVAWTKITAEGWQSPIAKFLSRGGAKKVERHPKPGGRRACSPPIAPRSSTISRQFATSLGREARSDPRAKSLPGLGRRLST